MTFDVEIEWGGDNDKKWRVLVMPDRDLLLHFYDCAASKQAGFTEKTKVYKKKITVEDSE